MAFTKKELIDEIFKGSNGRYTKKFVYEVYNKIFDIISRELESGNNVKVYEFGTFVPKKRKARKGRLLTGETINIPEHVAPVFQPCERLKERMNKG